MKHRITPTVSRRIASAVRKADLDSTPIPELIFGLLRDEGLPEYQVGALLRMWSKTESDMALTVGANMAERLAFERSETVAAKSHFAALVEWAGS